jgi:hypothetical protein
VAYDSQYYKEYYKQRKESLLEARRRKYATDKKYRTDILNRARIASVTRTLQRRALRQEARVIHAHRSERVYYLTAVEKMINRDRSVIDSWRNANPPIIPRPLYYGKRGWGLYSESQVMYMAKTLHRLDTGKVIMTYQHLSKLFHRVWNETFSEKKLTTYIKEILHGTSRSDVEKKKERQVRKGKFAGVDARG